MEYIKNKDNKVFAVYDDEEEEYIEFMDKKQKDEINSSDI